MLSTDIILQARSPGVRPDTGVRMMPWGALQGARLGKGPPTVRVHTACVCTHTVSQRQGQGTVGM